VRRAIRSSSLPGGRLRTRPYSWSMNRRRPERPQRPAWTLWSAMNAFHHVIERGPQMSSPATHPGAKDPADGRRRVHARRRRPAFFYLSTVRSTSPRSVPQRARVPSRRRLRRVASNLRLPLRPRRADTHLPGRSTARPNRRAGRCSTAWHRRLTAPDAVGKAIEPCRSTSVGRAARQTADDELLPACGDDRHRVLHR